MCAIGRIEEAEKVGKDWLIPNDAKCLFDRRVTAREYKIGEMR